MPLVVLTLTVAVPMVILDVLETVLAAPCRPTDPCRDRLGSYAYLADAPLVFVSLAVPVLAFLVPRIAVWATVVVGLAGATLPPRVISLPYGWLGLALIALLVGLADALGRGRQRLLAARWSTPWTDPQLPSTRLPWSQDTRRPAVILAGLLMMITVGSVIGHQVRYDDVRAFEQRAIRVDAVVVSPNTFEDTLALDAQGARVVLRGVVGTYSTGDTVPVLLDPTTRRVSLVAEPEDPSWRLGLAVIAGLLAICALVVGWSRGSRRRELFRQGGPTVRLRMRRTEDGWSFHGGDQESPAFALDDLVPIWMIFRDLTPAARHAQGSTEIETWRRYPIRLRSDDLAQTYRSRRHGLEVEVVGRLVDGFPVLVRDEETTYVSAGAVRDPWAWRRLPVVLGASRRLRRRSADPPGWGR